MNIYTEDETKILTKNLLKIINKYSLDVECISISPLGSFGTEVVITIDVPMPHKKVENKLNKGRK